MKHTRYCLVASLFVPFAAGSAQRQVASTSASRPTTSTAGSVSFTSAVAARAIKAPVIDGRSDDDVWSTAQVIDAFRTFDPVDAVAMQSVWPQFRNFGHVKQRLNPGRYPAFERRLKRVRSSGAS